MTLLPILAQAQGSTWMPAEASTTAAEVDYVFKFILYISLFFFSLIVALMVWFSIRYRRRKGYTPEAAPKSHLGVEIIWTAIPCVVVAAIFWVGFQGFLNMVTPPDDTYEIQVTGQKWSWLFEYPNGWVDGELHVPVNQAVKLTLRSEDVIHSLFIPDFRVKMDVVPGRYNKTWFKATQAGIFDLYCAEYCGTKHSDMITKVVVHEPGGYEKWLKDASSLLSPRLRLRDLTDIPLLFKTLRDGEAPVFDYLRQRCRPETMAGLAAWAEGVEPPEDLTAAVLEDLNEVIAGEGIHDAARFAGVIPGDDTETLLAKAPEEGEDLMQLNRYLLSDALPDCITRGPDMVEAGRYIYERKGGCKQCHLVDGAANIGPSFLGIYGQRHPLAEGEPVLVDENYIRESILNPQAKIVAGYEPVMPVGRLSDREIDAVIAFIKSLKKQD